MKLEGLSLIPFIHLLHFIQNLERLLALLFTFDEYGKIEVVARAVPPFGRLADVGDVLRKQLGRLTLFSVRE